MLPFIALLVGVLLGFLVRVAVERWLATTGRAAEQAPEVTDPAAAGRTDEETLYTLAAGMDDYFNQTAHPRDLLAHEAFRRGVERLGTPAYTTAEVLAYATGEHVTIACMALEALHHRRDTDEEAVRRLVVQVGRSYVWPLYFILRVLHARSPRPVVGAVLAQAHEWWVQNGVLLQVLGDFIEARSTAEEVAFGDTLETLSAEQVAVVEALLGALQGAAADALREALQTWQRTRVDRAFLQSVGRVWAPDAGADIVPHAALDEHLEALETALLQEPVRSVLLVGEAGVGKTTLTRRLATRLHPEGWTVFEAGTVDLMAGQTYLGELEARIQSLVTALGGGRRVLWVIPGFHELLFAGRHRYSPTGVLDMVLPFIEQGAFLVVGETQPAPYERMLQAKPRLRSAFQVVRLAPLDEDATLTLAAQWFDRQDGAGLTLGDETLREAFHLAQQYLGDHASPGHLLQFLQLARRRREVGERLSGPLTVDDLLVTLSGLTGLPTSILDDRRGLDLHALETLFKQHVLGQPEAVACLVERVAMIKAGLSDPTRPLGVFLFVGPTGTGKTEIAKTLAEFLFGSPERMIRLDMSEFQMPESLDRLLGEADETSGQVALVNQIRKQPFSVILLDEFEKAHPNVWDLFLQVFDDGRLTDRRGNTADFRHSIIILTSNLGAMVPQGTSIGFSSEGRVFSSGSVQRAVREAFRPEFINRIDRVVVFRPLSRGVMRDILYKELGHVLQRRGLRTREWAVEWEDSAIEFLLEQGFTADLGARPLKRAIERHLLAPLAKTIVTHQFPEGDQFLFVRSDGSRLQVEFIDPDAPEAVAPAAPTDAAALRLETLALDPQGERAEVAFLKTTCEDLERRIADPAWDTRKADALAAMTASDFWESPDRFRVLGEVEYMDRIEAGLQTAGSLLQRLEGDDPDQRTTFSRDLVQRLAEQLYLLDAAYGGFVGQVPPDAFLLVDARPDGQTPAEVTEAFARRVSRMYRRWAEKRRMRSEVLREVTRDGRYRFIMAVSGFGAYRLLAPEAGLHVFEVPRNERSFRRSKVWVRVAPQVPAPPVEGETLLARATAAFADEGDPATHIVRRYREEPSPLVRDSVRQWRTGRLDHVFDGDFDLM